MTILIRVFALTIAATLALGASAQTSFPGKPITIISPYPSGGGADTVVRLLQQKLVLLLGQPVIIDSKTGASGNIGTDYVVRAPADGYTLLVNNSTLTINASLGLRQPFNIEKDLQPIAGLASTPVAIAVHPDVPARTLAELIEYARKQDGKLAWSSCGNGTPQHLTGLRLAQAARINMTHVPYKGCSAAITDGIAGTVQVLFNTVPNLDAHVKAGRLRFLAVGSQERLSFQPELPTIAESSGIKGFEGDVWFGVFAPAAVPPEVVRKLEQAFLAAAADKEVQKAFADRQIAMRPMTKAQLQALVASDLATWKKLAADFSIKLD